MEDCQCTVEKKRDFARCTNKVYRREKSIAFYNVTMSYGFENQISAFCDNHILFCTFFCQGTVVALGMCKVRKCSGGTPLLGAPPLTYRAQKNFDCDKTVPNYDKKVKHLF